MRHCLTRVLLALAWWVCFPARVAGAEFGPYAEPGFPVLTSSVDFSGWEAAGFPRGNLAVRGLIIKLPHDLYVCFDQDLLRVAGIWQGKADGTFLTFTTIPAISWHVENRKSEPGQKDVPRPAGTSLAATGLQPGWLLKRAEEVTAADLADPRPPGPDPAEPGRGPLPAEHYQWLGWEARDEGVVLRYRCGGTTVEEHFAAGMQGGTPVVRRRLALSAGADSLTVNGGVFTGESSSQPAIAVDGTTLRDLTGRREMDWYYHMPGPVRGEAAAVSFNALTTDPASWHAPVRVAVRREARAGGLTVERIPLPVPNPWRRNVRPSGIAFFPDGRAVVCTIDGDVWTVSFPEAGGGIAEWRRFASGLHEPQSIAVRDGHVYAFTRDGVVRLIPDARGIAGGVENFCNGFTQTAETREYPMDMVVKPSGGFYIAKGGQMITRKTPQGGRVLEISADGKTVSEICTGLRQPYLGMHPVTGLLTATDQQGHWVPSTAIHVIRKGAYYGFEEAAPRPVPAVVETPACWIPHEVNQSAAGQVWCAGPGVKMGPLNGRLIHLSYFRPGLLTAFIDPDKKQAAVTPLALSFDFPLLKGAINPADGFLYVCGFRIWGTESKDMAGLARVRPAGEPSPLPVAIRAVPQGMHLRFPDKIDPASCRPEHFAAARWNYRRTPNYGSAHYKPDGTPGMEPLPCTGVQLSADGCGVLVHLPDMSPVEQLRLDWRLQSAAGANLNSFACLTLAVTEAFDAAAAGFDAAFTPARATLPAVAENETPAPTAAAGKALTAQLGCLACHSTDGSMEGMKGPGWKDLYGSEVELTNGKTLIADDHWLRESILKPAVKVRKGFANADTGMPPYEGILSGPQVESILLYLHSLSGKTVQER